jgi:cytoskeletal protein RodZ
MDITSPTSSNAAASATKSPEHDVKANGGTGDRLQPPAPQNEASSSENTMPAPSAAAPGVHQPKVQTAFIHKLWRCASSPIHPALSLRALNIVAACWKTPRYDILSHGRRTRTASSSSRPTSSPEC